MKRCGFVCSRRRIQQLTVLAEEWLRQEKHTSSFVVFCWAKGLGSLLWFLKEPTLWVPILGPLCPPSGISFHVAGCTSSVMRRRVTPTPSNAHLRVCRVPAAQLIGNREILPISCDANDRERQEGFTVKPQTRSAQRGPEVTCLCSLQAAVVEQRGCLEHLEAVAEGGSVHCHCGSSCACW